MAILPSEPAEARAWRVLVVEDEFLVAADIALMLQEIGCHPVGPIGDLDAAIRAAGEEPLDAALLDVNLHGRSAMPVADALAARDIPFVFCTGYDAQGLPRHGDAPKLAKPFQIRELQRAILALARRHDSR
jgi:DNA-binding response OmpR family regulator